MAKKKELPLFEEAQVFLQSLTDDDMLTEEEAATIIMNRRKIRKRHGKPIFFCPSDGRWQTQVLIDGKWKTKKWTHEKDLYKFLDNYYQEKDNPSHTLAAVYAEWLPLQQAGQPATANKHSWVWETYYVDSPLARMDVSDLTADDIETWLCDLCQREQLTKRKILEVKTLLNLVLDYADRRHYCDGNEARRIHRLAARAYVLPDPVKPPEEEVFSYEEMKALCIASMSRFHATGDTLPLLIPLAFQTGIRVGEGVPLRFGDFKDGYLHLCRSETKRYEKGKDGKTHRVGFEVVGHLKCNKDYRDIPLTRTAVEIVELIRAALEAQGLPCGDDDWLFARSTDGSRHTATDTSKLLTKLCVDAGIKPHSFHKIRKSFVSYLIAQGVPIPTVSRIVGHNNTSITLDVYARDVTAATVVREKLDALLPDFLL